MPEANKRTSANKLIHCMTALTCEVWLIPPNVHQVLTDICRAHAAGGEVEEAQHELAAAMPPNPANRKFVLQGNTAVIPVEGIIGRKFSSSLKSSGVTSIDVLERMIDAVISDETVQAMLLVFDSPGGIALGVPEVSAKIQKVKEARKGVVAYVDGVCASAAYWMASQADFVFAMQSSQVGSIGAYMAVLDRSREMEMAGMKLELFKSGPHKGMGMTGTSLTDEQRKMLQARVDSLGNDFKSAVRMGRGRNIQDEHMQGQTFDAKTALLHGMIDGIGDFEMALRDTQTLGKSRAEERQYK